MRTCPSGMTPTELRAEILRLHDRGCTARSIARYIGVSHKRVNAQLRHEEKVKRLRERMSAKNNGLNALNVRPVDKPEGSDWYSANPPSIVGS